MVKNGGGQSKRHPIMVIIYTRRITRDSLMSQFQLDSCAVELMQPWNEADVTKF